jgi:calcineurin-like phosphoesterase family protein
VTALRLGLLADLHLGPPGTPPAEWHGPIEPGLMRGRLAAALTRLARERLDALLLLGDLAHAGDRRSLRWVLHAALSLQLPTFVVPGNHDLDGGDDCWRVAHAEWPEQLRPLTARGRTLSPRVRIAGQPLTARGSARAAAEPPRLRASERRLLLWVTHYPLLEREPVLREAGLAYPDRLEGAAEVAARLARYRGPVLTLHGHLHVADAVAEDRILQLGVPALGERPHRYGILELSADGDRITVSLPTLRRGNPPALTGEWRWLDDRWETVTTLEGPRL